MGQWTTTLESSPGYIPKKSKIFRAILPTKMGKDLRIFRAENLFCPLLRRAANFMEPFYQKFREKLEKRQGRPKGGLGLN